MEKTICLSISQAARTADVPPIVLFIATGISNEALRTHAADHMLRAREHMERNAEAITARMESYSAHFESNGYSCPLPAQFRAMRKKGFPDAPPLVTTLLAVEMTTGVLAGVQDLDRIEGGLVLDRAQVGETFEGLRSQIICGAGETILRDARGIVASYFQGPDRRTSVTAATSALIFFAFRAPQVPVAALFEAMEMAMTIIAPCACLITSPERLAVDTVIPIPRNPAG